MYRFLLGTLLLGTSAAQGSEQVVWQIGKPDHNYAEFACAGQYQQSARKYTRPIVFDVDRSDPARDWPFIQPGPMDGWSPMHGQPWTIRFSLPEPPRGVYRLRIDFADVHKIAPPRYVISIGSRTGQVQLTPGGGDESLTNARAGKPQKIDLTLPADLFHKGANQVQLTCAEGSWVQYDSITLLNDPAGKLPAAEVQSVSLQGLPYFIRQNGKVCRMVNVAVALSAPAADLALHVEAGGETSDVPVKQLGAFGGITQEIAVPDTCDPLKVKVTATVGRSSKTSQATILPQRKWRIYVAPSSHTDVGYTDLQAKCAERHNQNTDLAVELLKKYPDFRWNLEVAWQAENYLATRKGAQLEEFLKAARADKIAVQALYCNILTGLCSHEQACRLTAYAARLHRQHQIPYRSAMISDVPTQEASLPMILANSGIRYFSSGINNDRAYTFTRMQNRCPCWWEGPDGSRVLMMYMHGYSHAQAWGLDSSLDSARARIVTQLRSYEQRPDYPYDALFLHGAVSDNCPLNSRLAEVCQAWNERYEYPRIILSPNADFYEYIEKQYGNKLPVVRGSAGTYWEDGAGSSARETAMVRKAHEQTANGEALLALADRLGQTKLFRPEVIECAWRNCMLYDEHTWGAYCSISEPEKPFTKAQWKVKAQFAEDAAAQAGKLQEQGMKGLAALVKTDGPSLVVFNPLSWARTDWVTLPEGMGMAEPGHTTSFGGTKVLVKDVPACGYRTLRLKTQAPTAETVKDEGTTLDSRFYRIEFNPETGGIKSIRDKELERELLDPKAPYGANQYVYAQGGNGTRIVANPKGPEPQIKISTSGKAKLRYIRHPGVREMMMISTSGTLAPVIVSSVILWENIKRIDIFNFVNKTLTYDKEGVYFTFPFAADNPTFRYEVPAGIVNANKDMLPGACLDWFTVQHFVEIESKDATIVWATPDAPLVCFQDINRGRWQTSLPLKTGHLYTYVMNNYWHTNYQAGQGGDHHFRFAITSRAKSDRTASVRFGWESSSPLLAVAVEANPRGKLPGTASLVSIAESNVVVIGMKRSETGTGLVVRLWEVEGRPTTTHVKLDPCLRVTKATACNLVEVPGEALKIQDSTIAVPIKGSGLATVLVE